MFPTPRGRTFWRCVSFALAVSCWSCAESAENRAIPGAGGADAASDEPTKGGAADSESSGLAGAGTDDAECRAGQTRCQGQLGFQRCAPDGVWGESQSCSGYSENGTSSYCVEDGSSGTPYAACVDPACFWWKANGRALDLHPAGVCSGPAQLRPCNAAGILLSPEPCPGSCRVVGDVDGRALGYCETSCSAGERECLGGPLYRECVVNVWSSVAQSCADGEACQPATDGVLSSIQCAGPCQTGTSRCAGGGDTVETCDVDHVWQPVPCLLGGCVQVGAQAQCHMECRPGERACAFDGAAQERRCSEVGLWQETSSCPANERCRIGALGALGCLACISAAVAGGNAWGVADSVCQAGGVLQCGGADEAGCGPDQACIELQRGAATLAYCASVSGG